MSAMPAPETGLPVDAMPARPKRWIAPHRRDGNAHPLPIRPGPDQTALLFSEMLANRFCRWPGSYCLWAENATIEDRCGLTASQVKRWLSHAEKAGRLLRFRGPAQFQRWLELTGCPDYGLDADGPPNMRCPTRVIVLVDLLPERIRPEGLYGPIGLDVDGAEVRHAMVQECAIEEAISAPSHPIWKLEGKEKMETIEGPNPIDSFSLITEDERTPKPAPVTPDPWMSISDARREELLSTARAEHPGLVPFPNSIKAFAEERLKFENPELFAGTPEPPAEARPAPEPISQGKPRHGTATGPRDDHGANNWSEQLIADMHRISRTANDHDRSFKINSLGELFASCLGDPDAIPMYKARLWEVVNGLLPGDCFADAVRYAKKPGMRNRGRAFAWFVKNKAPGYKALAMNNSDRVSRQRSPVGV